MAAEVPFAECEALFAQSPDSREAARCFGDLGPDLQAATDRLRQLAKVHPGQGWLLFYLGKRLWSSNRLEVADHYRRAAEVFAARHETTSEMAARLARFLFLVQIRYYAEAAEEVHHLQAAAEASGDPLSLTRSHYASARLLRQEKLDMEGADHLLERDRTWITGLVGAGLAEQADEVKTVLQLWLQERLAVSQELGRPGELESFAELTLKASQILGQARLEATARYYRAISLIDYAPPTPDNHQRAVVLAQEALDASRRAGSRTWQAVALRLLGKLSEGPEAQRYLEACIALGADESDLCRSSLAGELATQDPARAERLLAATLDTDDHQHALFAQLERERISWATRPRPEAIATSLEVLDAVETRRDAQLASGGRAGVLAAWLDPYAFLVGRLLAGSSSPEELETAWLVSERMRGRVLLEQLAATRAATSQPPPELVERLRALDEERAHGQSQLLDPQLGRDAQQQLEHELDRLDQEERELRFRIEVATHEQNRQRTPDFVSLAQVQEILAPDQALLAYQMAPQHDLYGDFGGGSWLFVVTQNHVKVQAIQVEPHVVAGAIDDLISLGDPETDPTLLVQLHEGLLGPVLQELPASIQRLLIIPDGDLHRLPFSALRSPRAGAGALVDRYQLTVVPSATLWRDWRREQTPPAPVPALVLADPQVSRETAAEVARGRRSSRSGPAQLGPLPAARREGKAVVCRLGANSLLLLGPDASEHNLKRLLAPAGSRFKVIHFGTHAQVDPKAADRSAVLLSRGDDQDGSLEPAEIAELSLQGAGTFPDAIGINCTVVFF